MDEKKNNTPQEQSLDRTGEVTKLLSELEEILPDNDAMDAAGLPRPEGEELPAPEEAFRDEEFRETFGEGEDLLKIFDETASDDPSAEGEEQPQTEPPEAEEPEAPAEVALRKGRPSRKKGYGLLGIPHLLATVVWLAVIVAIGVSIGRLVWVCAADVLAFGREEKEVSVTILDSDTLEDIAVKLQKEGLIRYPGLFKLYATFTDGREDINAGTYTLNTIYDYHALVDNMNYYSSERKSITVMIPEGYTCRQIFSLLEEKGVCTAEKLENYAATGSLDEYWFLKDVKRGDRYCLEGYLFPDTYEFYLNDEAEHVLEKMLDNFKHRFTEEMQESVTTLNERLSGMMAANGMGESYIAEHQMGVREVIIVASLIEKETAGAEESDKIASVIYNRLTNPANYPYLNIDAALLYVLGHKEALSTEDTQIDSPYNTYKYQGLVPGPISNPGLSSIQAALAPADTNFYFYALDTKAEERQHHFSKNLEEHEAFLASLKES